MADDDIFNDGTVICALHGMRYDPKQQDGCIRCALSVRPGKMSGPPPKMAATKSARPFPTGSTPAPSSVRSPPIQLSSAPPPPVRRVAAPPPPPPSDPAPGSVRPPPDVREDSDPPPRRSEAPPPIPFEPGSLVSSFPSQRPIPHITLMPGPEMQRRSRRKFLTTMGLFAAAGVAGAAWYFNPELTRDWLRKVTPLVYGSSAEQKGWMFVPSLASERACPLLLLLDHVKRTDRLCARYARHCEEHGWICAAPEGFGRIPAPGDNAAAAFFMDTVRANANVDTSRAVVGGFGTAGEAACRLAILEPNVFAGAILDSSKIGVWREIGNLARSDTEFFLATRTNDPDRDATLTMKDEMERRGLKVTVSEMAGVHEPMERDEMDPAFTWIDALQR